MNTRINGMARPPAGAPGSRRGRRRARMGAAVDCATGMTVEVYIPRETIAYTGRHRPPPEARHRPKRRRPRFAIVARLLPLIWLIRPCSCGAKVWPCRATLRTIRARQGWTAWIDDALVDWAKRARALAAAPPPAPAETQAPPPAVAPRHPTRRPSPYPRRRP